MVLRSYAELEAVFRELDTFCADIAHIAKHAEGGLGRLKPSLKVRTPRVGSCLTCSPTAQDCVRQKWDLAVKAVRRIVSSSQSIRMVRCPFLQRPPLIFLEGCTGH